MDKGYQFDEDPELQEKLGQEAASIGGADGPTTIVVAG